VLKALASAKNLQDLTDILIPTDYGRRIAKVEKTDFHGYEQIFNEVLIERANFIENLRSEEVDGFLGDYLRRFEVWNLSRILRGKASHFTPDEIKPWLTPLRNISEIDFETLLQSENIDEVIKGLKGTPYKQLEKHKETFHRYNSTLPLEYALKGIYYNNLMGHISPIFSQAKNCKDIIGLEVDLTNCFTALTPLVYGYSDELIESLLIDFSYQIPINRFKEVLKAKTPQAVLELLRPYTQVVNYILSKKDDRAMAEGLKLLRNKIVLDMREKYLDFPYIIDYLILCELECRDLTCIALSLGYNYDPSDYLSFSI
jgi:vacuolar-type H+-ATPase subunit C/Vma6